MKFAECLVRVYTREPQWVELSNVFGSLKPTMRRFFGLVQLGYNLVLNELKDTSGHADVEEVLSTVPEVDTPSTPRTLRDVNSRDTSFTSVGQPPSTPVTSNALERNASWSPSPSTMSPRKTPFVPNTFSRVPAGYQYQQSPGHQNQISSSSNPLENREQIARTTARSRDGSPTPSSRQKNGRGHLSISLPEQASQRLKRSIDVASDSHGSVLAGGVNPHKKHCS